MQFNRFSQTSTRSSSPLSLSPYLFRLYCWRVSHKFLASFFLSLFHKNNKFFSIYIFFHISSAPSTPLFCPATTTSTRAAFVASFKCASLPLAAPTTTTIDPSTAHWQTDFTASFSYLPGNACRSLSRR